MRSSIACSRCRRSKVKCVNSGVNTTCRSCEASGRECKYPVPAAGGRRREDSFTGSSARVDDTGDSEPRRQRPRKNTASGASLARPLDQVSAGKSRPFDPSLLTPAVWQELFDIFQGHFSTDLPFIHPPSFSKPLRQPTPDASAQVRPPASDEFLLAFLALTARFHPKLVSTFASAQGSSPLAASEMYAALARAKVAGLAVETPTGDVEHVQTLLMLSFYEWSICRGDQAWTFLGMAIRSAQAMGLHYDSELDDEPATLSLQIEEPQTQHSLDLTRCLSGPEDQKSFIKHEIRRRTMWSCFMLEKYMSNGKYRPATLRGEYLNIQLPTSEHAFLFGNKVETNLFNQGSLGSEKKRKAIGMHRRDCIDFDRRRNLSEEEYRNYAQVAEEVFEDRERETLSSLYVEVMDIFGKTTDQLCKSAPSSTDLKRQLEYFTGSLPRTLPRQYMLNAQNTSAHINLRTSSAYSLMHIIACSCQLLLERSNLPICPLRFDRLSDRYEQVPRDGSWRPREEQPSQDWLSSMDSCMKTSRSIVELAQTCQEWNVLVETPIVAFALYLSAFMGIYSIQFPFLEPSQNQSQGSSVDVMKSLELLAPMAVRLPLASQLIKTLTTTHKYLASLVSGYLTTPQPASKVHESIRAHLTSPMATQSRERLAASLSRFSTTESDRASPEFSLPAYPQDRRESAVTLNTTASASEVGSPVENGTHRQSISMDVSSISLGGSMRTSEGERDRERWSAVNNSGSNGAPGQTQTVAGPSGFRSYSGTYSPQGWTAANTNGVAPGYAANHQQQQQQQQSQQPQQQQQQHQQQQQQQSQVAIHTQNHSQNQMPPPASMVPKTLPTVMIGAEDLAAFVSGADFREYARRLSAKRPRFEGDCTGWLGLVYGSGKA